MTSYKSMHRFIVFTACCTFLLIIAGGLVTSTQSGLSVPDWPNTYGHFMFAYPLDQMVGGIFYEHTHRMIASIIGVLTIIVAVWLWKREDRRWVKNLGFFGLGTVVAQGLLGGLTVLFLLPTAVSVSHATLAQTFFAIMAALSLVTSSWWRSTEPKLQAEPKGVPLLTLATITSVAIYIQLILGAVMRHNYAGLVVPDFPLAYGQVFPSLTPEALARYNDQLIQQNIRVAADGAVTAGQIVIHMLHRTMACVVGILTVWTAVRLLKQKRTEARFRTLGILLLCTVLVQISLGGFTVLSQKAVDITTAHVATGALLLVLSVLTSLHAFKVYGVKQRQVSLSYNPREATA